MCFFNFIDNVFSVKIWFCYEEFFNAMHKLEKEYEAAIEKHFDKHLSLLGVPAR